MIPIGKDVRGALEGFDIVEATAQLARIGTEMDKLQIMYTGFWEDLTLSDIEWDKVKKSRHLCLDQLSST